MEITSILCVALAAISVVINSITCIDAEIDNLTTPTNETESDISTTSEPQQEITSTQSDSDTNADPLSPAIFPYSVYNILSPEVFSQSDPITYFFSKTSHLSRDPSRELMLHVDYFLSSDKFPQPYVPYAAVLSSLLRCVDLLNRVQSSIRAIQQSKPRLWIIPVADISSPDPELSMLFTSDIFADDNPPSVVLRKLLEIPDEEIPNVMIRLKNLLHPSISNGTVSLCHFYIKHLLEFFELYGRKTLSRFRRRIAKMQKTIPNSSHFVKEQV